MPVPKKKKSKAKVAARRGGVSLKKVKAVNCKKCGSLRQAHVVCKICGTYKGKEIIDVEKREKRKEKKLKDQTEEE